MQTTSSYIHILYEAQTAPIRKVQLINENQYNSGQITVGKSGLSIYFLVVRRLVMSNESQARSDQ